MKRRVAVVAALVLVVSACGGSTADTSATSTSAVVIADVVSDPGMPDVLLLLTPSGAPEVIDRICVEISAGANVLGDEVTRNLSRALEVLGIDRVDSDCRAVLRIVASGRRTSANYEVKGLCWTGWSYRVTTELTVDAVVKGEWTDTDRQAPPDSIPSSSVCPRQDDPVLRSAAFLRPVFQDMWGDMGLIATHAAVGGVPPGDLEFTDEIRQLIATNLMTEPVDGTPNGWPLWQVLRAWTSNMSTEGASARLRPIAPYLIALMDRLPSGSWEASDSIDATLRVISGRVVSGTAGEWWEWWTTWGQDAADGG